MKQSSRITSILSASSFLLLSFSLYISSSESFLTAPTSKYHKVGLQKSPSWVTTTTKLHETVPSKNDDCTNVALDFTTDRRSSMKNMILAIGSSFVIANGPTPVQAAVTSGGSSSSSAKSKTLPEEYRQGTSALGDTEERAPIPQSSYIKLDSGLTYADIRQGTGELAEDGKRVNIQWVLRRSDGYFVDSSEKSDSVPFICTIGDPKGAIKGVNEGIKGMKEGGIRRLLVPISLAYVDGLEDDKPGPVPPGFGPKQQMRRVQKTRKDVPGDYLFFEVKLTRVR